jgi:hypothetical protein
MHSKDAIRQTMDMGDMILSRYVDDLSDADLKIRPIDGMNPIAWQLGHLVASERGMVEGIKAGTCPPLPEGFDALHGRENTANIDPAQLRTKAEYLSLLKAQREATKKLLDSLDDAALDAPGPERIRQMAPTVGATFVMIGNHTLMHLGQFVAVRRKLNKAIAI